MATQGDPKPSIDDERLMMLIRTSKVYTDLLTEVVPDKLPFSDAVGCCLVSLVDLVLHNVASQVTNGQEGRVNVELIQHVTQQVVIEINGMIANAAGFIGASHKSKIIGA